MNSVAKTIKSGLLWSGLAQFIIQIIKVGRWIILLYLISPESYGLFSLAVIVVGIPQTLIDQGVGSALVQSDKNFTSTDLSTYFWTLTSYGLLLLFGSFFFADYIAHFFSEPELASLIILLSGAFLVESVGKVSHGLLRKRLMFKYLAQVETVSFVIATFITVAFAYMEYGTKSLVYGLFSEYLLTMVFHVRGAGFHLRLVYSIASIKKIYVFFRNIGLIHFITSLMRYTDDLLIGFFYGKAALGVYDRAYLIVHLPMRLVTNKIIMVLFPAYSQKRMHPEEIRESHLKILHYSSVFYFFILGAIILLAKPAVVTTLPEKWHDLAFFIPILAVGGVIHAFINYNYSIFLSFDRTDLQLKYGIFTRGIIMVSYITGAFFGVKGIAIGYVVGSFIAFFPESMRAWQEIGLTLSDYIYSVKKVFIISLGIFLLSFASLSMLQNSLHRLFLGGLVYISAYFVLYRREIFSFGRNILGTVR